MTMSALRLSQIVSAAAVGLLVASFPTRAAAQGCGANTCTAVNHVQVTVPKRLGLNAAGPAAAVRANTSWRLQVSAVQAGSTIAAAAGSDRSNLTEIRDTPATATVAMRYTLVGS